MLQYGKVYSTTKSDKTDKLDQHLKEDHKKVNGNHYRFQPTKLPPLKQNLNDDANSNNNNNENNKEQSSKQNNNNNKNKNKKQYNDIDDDDTLGLPPIKVEMYGRPQARETLKKKRRQVSTSSDSPPQKINRIPSYCVISYFANNQIGELFYMMKNGQIGMISQDEQRLVLDPSGGFIQIWPKIDATMPDILNPDENSVDNENVTKLMTYAKIFKDSNVQELDFPRIRQDEEVPMRHVKYCMRNENGMMFRMDNRVTQINFPDRSKLIVFWEEKSLITTHSLFGNGLFMTIESMEKSGNEDLKKKYCVAKKMIELIYK